MLERIFYLEEYGKKLWEKVSKKTSKLRSRIDVVSGELMGYSDANYEAIKVAQALMDDSLKDRIRVEKEFKLSELKYNESKVIWQFYQVLLNISQKEELNNAKAGLISGNKIVLEMAEKADGLVGVICKNKELSKKLSDTENELNKVSILLNQIDKDLHDTQQRYNTFKKGSAEEQPKLLSLKTRLTDALVINTEIESINKKIEEYTNILKKIMSDLDNKAHKEKTYRLELERFEKSLEDYKKEINVNFIDPDYRSEMQEGTKLENEAAALEENANELQIQIIALKNTILVLEKKLEACCEDVSKIKRDMEIKAVLSQKSLLLKQASINERKESAKHDYDKIKIELEAAVKEMDRNTAYLLSKNLKEGAPCPVCGSLHHPIPALKIEENGFSDLDKRINNLRDKTILAENNYKESERDLFIVDEQIKALIIFNKQFIDDVKSKTEQYNIEKNELLEYENYKQEIQKLNEMLNKAKLLENSIVTEIKVNKENLEHIEKNFIQATDKLNTKKQEYSLFLNKYKIENIASEIRRFSDADKKISMYQKKIDDIGKLAEKNISSIDKIKEEIRLQNDEIIRLKADISNLISQKCEKELKLNEFKINKSIEDEIEKINEKLLWFVNNENQLEERLKAVEREYNTLTVKKHTLNNQNMIYSEALNKEESILKSSLQEKGFDNIYDVEKSILPKEKQDELKREIKEYEQLSINIKAQKQIIQKKLNSRSITEDEWDKIQRSYDEIASCKEELITKSEVAKNNLIMLKNKHNKWLELSNTYNELTNKYGLLEQIQKLLRADKGKDNSFIDYIAEERLRYVAAKASETLGIMTKYKYELELDTNMGFIIRDNKNGGVNRMVSSLSGGETFLTSLSLALALSEQIQLKGQSPLEFFFLDEGFGTLDNNLLDTVIDALERLSKKERVIGIISHVPELKSRIARRLVVNPPSDQGSGSIVKVEKA